MAALPPLRAASSMGRAAAPAPLATTAAPLGAAAAATASAAVGAAEAGAAGVVRDARARYAQLDPLFLAISRLKRRRYEDSVELCNTLLRHNPRDEAAWALKAATLTQRVVVDDTEIDEESVGDVLMDDNAIAQLPRPGTSLARPLTGAQGPPGSARRPTTTSGRPVSGYARVSTARRTATGSVENAFEGQRPGTSRPATSSGRFVRLGTASLATIDPSSEKFIDVERLDLKHYASKPVLSKLLCDFLLFHERDARRALELASHATSATNFKDWWWKLRIGQCMYRLGMLRDAERQIKSSLRDFDSIEAHLHLGRLYARLDQPIASTEALLRGSETHPGDTHLVLHAARIYEALNDTEKAVTQYRRALSLNPASIEALASLASMHFYQDQPEVALRFYRRLLQMGVSSAELWCNVGLCCFYASQYDLTLNCFERALQTASGETLGDVWYNLGLVAIGIGDVSLAYETFKLAIAANPQHIEAFNNLGVLELRQVNLDRARTHFGTAMQLGVETHVEPFFNSALLAFKQGMYEDAFKYASRAAELAPEHADTRELLDTLHKLFDAL